MLGLAGAQRVGKSTLALEWSKASGMPFLQTSASATFRRLMFDPKVDYDFPTRLLIQNEILKDCEAIYRSARGQFITDRTPLDFMAYLLADVLRNNVTGALAENFRAYMTRCYDVLNAFFPAVLIVQPGIPLVEEEGKAPANLAHMDHINALVMGLASDARYEGSHWFVPRKHLSIEERMNCVDFVVKRLIGRHESFLQSRKEAGEPVVFH